MFTVSSEYRHLPTAEELPDSDETPVDNELQNDIPNILLNLLRDIWDDRFDWFWGVDMAVYYEPNLEKPENSKAVVPDGFLAIGVPRLRGESGRLSYSIWEEKVLPILFFEVISKTYNSEYEEKLELYQNLGIRYYVIYNPFSGKGTAYKDRPSLEVYQLVNGKYELMPSIALLPEGGEMVWLEGVGLGIGCIRNELYDWRREWLYWYDRNGVRYPTAKEQAAIAEEIAERASFAQRRAEEIAEQERLAKLEAEAIAEQANLEKQQAELAQQLAEQKAQRLAERLRALGLDPDEM
ncbi:Putative restriction endonuclease domain-containing protein [Tumidithrix helvetica PCC 7403]|uniref:Uma2 family endonuclease n=1 Tax=Tumidithrix helvetica TaxID=3457545 RepID=UPI003CC0EF15